MDRRLPACGIAWTMLLAACSAPLPGVAQPAPMPTVLAVQEPARLARAPSVPAHVPAPALMLEGYKKAFAERVAHASPETFDEPLPRMLKSVVVVDVTVNRDGKLAAVSIRRSNGYKDLENVALNSVRRAAPFAAPAAGMRRHDGSVNFLETFLFRSDGRFQIRSLAGAQ